MQRRFFPVTIIFLGMLATIPIAGFTDEAAQEDLARQIRQTIAEIHSKRMEKLHLQEHYRNEIAEVEQRIVRLEEDLKLTRLSIERITTASGQPSEPIQKDVSSHESSKEVIKNSSALTLITAKKMKNRIEQGIPYRKTSRENRLDRIIEDLQSSNPKISSKAIDNFLKFASEELRLSKTTEFWNEPIILDHGERQKQAYQVRLGLINHFYISEDETSTGMAACERDSEWLSVKDKKTKRYLKTVLDVLRQQVPPDFVGVPLHIPPHPATPKNSHESIFQAEED